MGKAPLLDAAAQKGVTSSTLFGKETRRELCESTELVCNLENRYLSGVPIEGMPSVPQTRVRDVSNCASLVF